MSDAQIKRLAAMGQCFSSDIMSEIDLPVSRRQVQKDLVSSGHLNTKN